jgi:hypothetical protein
VTTHATNLPTVDSATLAFVTTATLLRHFDQSARDNDVPFIFQIVDQPASPEHGASAAWARQHAIRILRMQPFAVRFYVPSTMSAFKASGDSTGFKILLAAAVGFTPRDVDDACFVARDLAPTTVAAITLHEASHLASHGTPCGDDGEGCGEQQAQAFAAQFEDLIATRPWAPPKHSAGGDPPRRAHRHQPSSAVARRHGRK